MDQQQVRAYAMSIAIDLMEDYYTVERLLEVTQKIENYILYGALNRE
jgi:hypothetical protein